MIKNDALYSVREASEILDIKLRTMQYYAKKLDAKMIDGRYLFTGHQLKEIRTQKATQKRTQRKNSLRQTSDINATLRQLITQINNDQYITEVLTAIAQNKHLEEMTKEEYESFVARLHEANRLEQRIEEYKEEIQRMEDYVKDYRQNIEYLRKSLDVQQLQMGKLLEQISERNTIDAKDRGII